jgi:hypothetical protein
MTFDEQQAEYEALTDEQKRIVEQCIIDCQSHGAQAEIRSGGDQAYAYPSGFGGVAWGLNAASLNGWCIARDIRR